MVRMRPLEMSFSTISWGRGEGGLRLGTSHTPWGHTWSFQVTILCGLVAQTGKERRRAPGKAGAHTQTPDRPASGASRPPSGRKTLTWPWS